MIFSNQVFQEAEPYSYDNADVDYESEKVDEYLFLSLGYSSKQNAWAGPDHWKFQKAKGSLAGDIINHLFFGVLIGSMV